MSETPGTARGNVRGFQSALSAVIPSDRLIDDPLRRLAYGTDASFYRLIPQLVVCAESADEVREVLAQAQRFGVAVTFRAAGTSLSGQAVTDSVLLTLGHGWQGHSIEDGGSAIRLQPGVIGARANELLAPHMRRIGPDPASINTAKIGGIAANNASGMCCGTAHNSYQTLRALKLILADGSTLDTGSTLSCDMFRTSHGDLLGSLETIANEVKNTPHLSALIHKKYRLKNTTGYAINALLDFDDPIDILQHLMIGSEGTLGFIAEICLETVREEPCKATGLLVFESLETACRAVSVLDTKPVSAVELIDRKGLASVAHLDGMPPGVADFPDQATALLIEVCGESEKLLQQRLGEVTECALEWQLLGERHFTREPAHAAKLWSIRKGLFPAVGAVRATGTTVIIEDVAFPVENLAAGVTALQALLEKHSYHEAVMFGHALQGNLHFVFTQSFEAPEEVERYGLFMDELAQLVAVEYQGSLKAEHGTGRNMAPFVELEWGAEAYRLMWRIKQILDPNNILNPGVVLNEDPDIHVKNLKPMPPADPLVDRCIECGFCEPSCPSRDLTLSPRQRIASWREINRLQALKTPSTGERQTLKELRQGYDYAGTDTCAACGLCELRCPVGINTGDLTRAIRGARNKRMRWLAEAISRHFGLVVKLARGGLKTVDALAAIIGRARFAWLAQSMNRVSVGYLPLWTAAVRGGRVPPHQGDHYSGDPDNTVVYFPACPGRMLDPDLSRATVEILERAGFAVIIPTGMDSECCGMPFASKGFADIARDKGEHLRDKLRAVSGTRKLPVICDAAPCSAQLAGLPRDEFEIIDLVDFLHDRALPRLHIARPAPTVALHVTCSSQHSATGEKLQALTKACAQEVIRPASVTCCGFAGDKGFTLPALNASALSHLAAEIPSGCTAGYSNSRTCEIGLSEHAGIPYRHIAYLLLEVSRPALGEKSTSSA
ncbi:MAG: FAD-binding and (Fe-S)-binding domain-containing protein [Halioglobus sp.]